MIDEGAGEAVGIVAGTAIRAGYDMVDRIGHAQRIYHVALNVAGSAGLYLRIDHGVVENVVQIETVDTVADCAIDVDDGMAINGSARSVTIVAGIATTPDDRRLQMIGIGAGKRVGIVTGTAFEIGFQVGLVLALGDDAVVAGRTIFRYVAVVVPAVRLQADKAIGIVAGVTLGAGLDVVHGLADCRDIVMTFATSAEVFLVIDERDLGPPEG